MINQVYAKKQELVAHIIHLLKDLMPTGFPLMLFQIFNLNVVRLLLQIIVIFKHV